MNKSKLKQNIERKKKTEMQKRKIDADPQKKQKCKKGKSTQIPQGGWGVGSKEPTRVVFYYTRL